MLTRRRPILLLESIIAFLIMGVVIQLLFTGYRHGAVALKKAREEKEAVVRQEKLALRLQQLFDRAVACKARERGGFAIEYVGGADIDPHFRGSLEGELYVDQEALVFVTRSQEGAERLEVLYERVQAFELDFFDLKEGVFAAKFPTSKPPMIRVTLDNHFILPLFL